MQIEETGTETESVDWRSTEDAPEVQLGQNFSNQQRNEVNQVLEKFPEIPSSKPGRTQLIEHHYSYYQETHPAARAYQEEVMTKLQSMQEAGIIEPSRSEWAFPIVVVQKKDEGVRICVDYRKLNGVTQGNAYPMPRIDNILDNLGQARFLSTLDLAKGYLQVPVAAEDMVKTAFVSPMGLYQFRVMPFGLCRAPATFQHLMDSD